MSNTGGRRTANIVIADLRHMRIDKLNRASVTQTAQSAPRDNPQENDAVASPDQASVSQLARSLAPPASARIEQLRLQVQSGNYEVPAQAVASAIIDEHLQE
jgi:anti-sigma28 factor (negative regulator of flagellin synthesis)